MYLNCENNVISEFRMIKHLLSLYIYISYVADISFSLAPSFRTRKIEKNQLIIKIIIKKKKNCDR